jgi:hypothetical protein
MDHSALHNLPAAVLDWLGDLDLPAEPRSDCAACPQACAAADLPAHPDRFHDDARCCTYHPALSAWMVGRILVDGGQGAALIAARMAERDGVSAAGIRADTAHTQRRIALGDAGFGRAVEVRCPFWVGGELACGIWSHRDSVCRSWFCRSGDGPRSVAMWMRLKSLLRALEDHLRRLCEARGTPPPDDAPEAVLMDWYRQCAAVVAELTAADLEGDAVLTALRAEVVTLRAALEQPTPPLLGAAIHGIKPVPGGLSLTGYSCWDPVVVPAGIFRFLGRLTGEQSWRDALAAANAELEEPIPEALVEEMYRRGALQVLRGPEDLEVGGAIRVGRGEDAGLMWMDEVLGLDGAMVVEDGG